MEKPGKVVVALQVFEGLIGMALVLCAAALFFAGPAIWAYQAYTWMRSGVWHSLSVVDGLVIVGVELDWLYRPVDFIGVHKALEMAPASLVLMLLALVPAYFHSRLSESSPFGAY